MMAKTSDPEEQKTVVEHDPYQIRSIEHLLSLFDRGEFLTNVMSGHADLQRQMIDHRDAHGAKGCKGSMTLQISYDLGTAGDLGMSASVSFTAPKKPSASAGAYLDENGDMTLFSPMMKRMHQPVRDVTDHDPETGEVRDA